MERKEEFLHSWLVFMITLLVLLYLLVNKILWANLILTCVTMMFFVLNGLSLRAMVKVSAYALLFSASIFFLTIINPGRDNIFHVAVSTMIKLFLVSFVSICSASAIDYTKVILYLVVHKKLPASWGYPILLAINSIALFKDEFERIKLNARLRGLPWKDRVFVIFPLLVFAIRHSQRGALSLVTRGLNEQKTFYFTYALSDTDKKRFFFFCLFYFGLVIVTQITLR